MKYILTLALATFPTLLFSDTRAELHVAVYASGILVDTQRKVTLGKGMRKIETANADIEIDRLDRNRKWNLDPQTKTYTETVYQKSSAGLDEPITGSTSRPVTLKISRIVPSVEGPHGAAEISGHNCLSYTIRLIADFANAETGKVVATETILEKLWVTESAPDLEKFRSEEKAFTEALATAAGTETANFRWLLREFNRIMLERNGNTKDFKLLQTAYLEARAKVSGVTVRQLAGWNWRPMNEAAAKAMSLSAEEMTTFIVSVAAGLGAPPPDDDKSHPETGLPKWAQDLAQDLGRTGPTAMMLEEIKTVRKVPADAKAFTVPTDYRKP